MKILIFDSGTLINLSMNGLLYILEDLKKNFDGKFIITYSVKREIVDRPVKIDRFELGALRLMDLIDKGVIELVSALDIDQKELDRRTYELLDRANHFLKVKEKWIDIVSEAEISCLALSEQCTKKGIENLIAIDERTLRILCENPKNLVKIMSHRLHQMVEISDEEYETFSNFRFIRSSEIVYVAYKKNLINIKDKRILEALLYATKYKGSSISFEEINVLRKL
jgi:hypothetical protein